VDPDRNRVSLTAKKTLLDSKLPIISNYEDVKAGMLTHAVVSRTYEKHIMVEFYNNIKATIPHRETGYVTRAIKLSYFNDSSVRHRVINYQRRFPLEKLSKFAYWEWTSVELLQA
jgi:hypothetical protein